MTFEDINFSGTDEKSESNWLSSARATLTSTDRDTTVGIYTGTEPSWLGGFKLGDDRPAFGDLFRSFPKDKDEVDHSPRAEAERILFDKLPEWKQTELIQERKDFKEAMDRRMLQVGIGIP